ncbi:MAG: HTH-type transcriptional regulator CysB [Gammaproteobacteria bacterium]
MKLQQLQLLVEIARHNFNISDTADALYTSQPGISKQMKLLEQELNVALFIRNGKILTDLTPVGKRILSGAIEILNKADDIHQMARDYNKQQGVLSIAATHTQARYILPDVISRFMECFPDIVFNLQQGTPRQVAKLASLGDVDFAIATEAVGDFENLLTMPCYRWNRCLVVKKNHPLASVVPLTIDEIVKYPIITYLLGYTGRYKLDEAFSEAGLTPNIVLTAVDADVIKTYVKLGLGIGIIANMAFNRREDMGLVSLDAGHLFGSSVTYIAMRKDKYVRSYIFKFIETFAPHLDEAMVKKAMACSGSKERKQMFDEFQIPTF